MAVITTVNGDIVPEELGVTSMHEHTFFDISMATAPIKATLPPLPPEKCEIRLENMSFLLNEGMLYCDEFNKNTSMETTVFELDAFREAGGQAIVDASPCFMRGDDIENVRRAADASGVKIVCATGFKPAACAEQCNAMTEAQMYDMCMGEITGGIDGTDIRPGIVKTFLDADVDGDLEECERKSLRACGRAAVDSGYVIQVHKPMAVSDGVVLKAVEELFDLGMQPEKIQMLHQTQFVNISLEDYVRGRGSRLSDWPLAHRLFEMGVVVSLDTWGDRIPWGNRVMTDDVERMRMLVHFLDEGYADQIVLGHDCVMTMFGVRVGGWGMTRIFKYVVSNLRAFGYGDDVIHKLLVENPKRILSHEPI